MNGENHGSDINENTLYAKYCSKPFVYLCIVRKTTIKFNKTKNKF